MKKILTIITACGLLASCGGNSAPAKPATTATPAAAPAAPVEVTVEAVFDITGGAPAAGYLTVKGPTASVDKDTVDATTGASKAKGTEVWNTYRAGEDKKSTLPGGIQSLVKYAVSPEKAYKDDNLVVTKADTGVITVLYIHRGTAYKIVTDEKGVYTIPGGKAWIRKVANLNADGSNTVAKDFSATGKVSDVDWAKVWDSSIAEGTVIATIKDKDGKDVEVKTGKVADDVAASSTPFSGSFQLALEGKILTVKGTIKK